MALREKKTRAKNQNLKPVKRVEREPEAAEFSEILRRLRAGDITAERAMAHILSMFQMGMAGAMRSFGELEPEMVKDLIRHVSEEMATIDARYGQSDALTDEIVKPRPAKKEYNLGSKNDAILLREKLLIDAASSSNQPQSARVLLELVRSIEADVMPATVTATLNRLCELDVIQRPRKGVYIGSVKTQSYLAEVHRELEARGL